MGTQIWTCTSHLFPTLLPQSGRNWKFAGEYFWCKRGIRLFFTHTHHQKLNFFCTIFELVCWPSQKQRWWLWWGKKLRVKSYKGAFGCASVGLLLWVDQHTVYCFFMYKWMDSQTKHINAFQLMLNETCLVVGCKQSANGKKRKKEYEHINQIWMNDRAGWSHWALHLGGALCTTWIQLGRGTIANTKSFEKEKIIRL